MAKRNPKQDGSNLWDCKPQCGPCPLNCNQCFYNRPGAFYVPIDEPHMPTVEEVGEGIVRVNCGHDSNVERELVVAATERYPRKFFNTSISPAAATEPDVRSAAGKRYESSAHRRCGAGMDGAAGAGGVDIHGIL